VRQKVDLGLSSLVNKLEKLVAVSLEVLFTTRKRTGAEETAEIFSAPL
jgi:hypothetical protein